MGKIDMPDHVELLAVESLGVPQGSVDLSGVEYDPGPDGGPTLPMLLVFVGRHGALHNDHVHVVPSEVFRSIIVHPQGVAEMIARCWQWARATGQEMRVRAELDQVETAMRSGDLK